MTETSDIELPEVSDEMVDIFARKFWAIPRVKLTSGSQDVARTALAPVLAEHDRQLRAEVNGLRRENERLREENIRRGLAAERDVCSGCMQREQQRDAAWATARDNGVKYEQAKQAWHREQDRAVQAEFELSRIATESEAQQAALKRIGALYEQWLRESRSGAEPLPRTTVAVILYAALRAPESNAPAPSPVTAGIEAYGETTEAQEARELPLDPDCRDGKHGSCVGGPCECPHHTHLPIGDPGEPEEGPYCEACGDHWPCREMTEAQKGSR